MPVARGRSRGSPTPEAPTNSAGFLIRTYTALPATKWADGPALCCRENRLCSGTRSADGRSSDITRAKALSAPGGAINIALRLDLCDYRRPT